MPKTDGAATASISYFCCHGDKVADGKDLKEWRVSFAHILRGSSAYTAGTTGCGEWLLLFRQKGGARRLHV